MNKKETLYFWGHKGNHPKRFLSNFYPVNFKVNGITFSCSEHYFMYLKALLFKDHEIALKILEENDPLKIKQLGRLVKNFDSDIWNEHKVKFMYNACYQKFNQNPELKNYLMSLKDFEIVEASPYDRIWGIGYKAENAEENRNDWGKNLLGRVLMKLANDLK